ncbi:hypothetical protein M9458_056899, partial [Cirrhinus mrigala]
FLLLLLEQGEKSLKGHTRLFVFLANLTSYPDDMLCSFYDTSLNSECRAVASEDGRFCGVDTLDPALSPASPHCAECMPEPPADGEPLPAMTDKQARAARNSRAADRCRAGEACDISQ